MHRKFKAFFHFGKIFRVLFLRNIKKWSFFRDFLFPNVKKQEK